MNETINIIGAGLAGSEAALCLANHGFLVELYDMKPIKKSNAHMMDSFCELVCNNSFCSSNKEKPLKLLYEELKVINSELVPFIEKARVNDSDSIAVDKRVFSKMVTEAIESNNKIHVNRKEVLKLPDTRPTILATGPLTSGDFLPYLKKYFNDMISITDANSVVVSLDSIDKSKVITKSDDVFEIRLDEAEYLDLEYKLKTADTVIPHKDDDDFRILQCLPVEVLATRPGKLAESKLKSTDKSSYATIVLRKDDRLSNSAVLSEFTTRMRFSEQERVIHSIRGLENAKIVRHGQLHYNTFINAPYILNEFYEVKEDSGLYVVGQLAGIDGYLPAISSAVVAASSIIRKSSGLNPVAFPLNTIIGSLAHYVSTITESDYKPMVPLFQLLDNSYDSPDKIFDKSLNSIKKLVL